MAHQIRIILLTVLVLTYQTWGKEPDYKRSQSEGAVNKLINIYLNESHTYQTLTAMLDNKKWDFPGLKAFFREQSDEKRDLAIKLMEYQSMRNGNVIISDVGNTLPPYFENPIDMLKEVHNMERKIKVTLLEMYDKVWHNKDFEFSHQLVAHLERQTMILSKIDKSRNHLKKQEKNFVCPVAEKFMC